MIDWLEEQSDHVILEEPKWAIAAVFGSIVFVVRGPLYSPKVPLSRQIFHELGRRCFQ